MKPKFRDDDGLRAKAKVNFIDRLCGGEKARIMYTYRAHTSG
jgi:hypothetical protein